MIRLLVVILITLLLRVSGKCQQGIFNSGIIGADSVCMGTVYKYGIRPQPGIGNYYWTCSDGMHVSFTPNPAADTVVDARFENSASGRLFVNAITPDQDTIALDSLYITVFTIPSYQDPEGRDTFCQGLNYHAILYNVAPINHATAYQWDFSGVGATTITDPSKNFVYVNFLSGVLPGIIKVKGINQCGEGEFSLLGLPITVNPTPTPSIISADTGNIVCKNARLMYTADKDYKTYSWSMVNGGKLTGALKKEATVDWDATPQGQISLTVSNDHDCMASTNYGVIKNDGSAPFPPNIWLFGYNLLVCSDSSVSSYQWYHGTPDGTIQLIPGAIFQDYHADSSSYQDYYVTACLGTCCNESSRFNFHAQTAATTEVDQPRVMLYPNPARDMIYLKNDSQAGYQGMYGVVDPMGRIVKSGIIDHQVAEIGLSGLAVGLYFLYIRTEGNPGKFIKFLKN